MRGENNIDNIVPGTFLVFVNSNVTLRGESVYVNIHENNTKVPGTVTFIIFYAAYICPYMHYSHASYTDAQKKCNQITRRRDAIRTWCIGQTSGQTDTW